MLNLPAWRQANNHTQETLAKALGVAVRTVRRWEAGQTAQPPDLPVRLVAVSAVLAAPVKPATVSYKTHPALYNREQIGRRAYNRYGPLHPQNILNEAERVPFLIRPGDDMSGLLATVLVDPLYIQRRDAVRAGLQLQGPQPPRLSQEEWEAKARAGASFEELFPKAKKPVDNSN